MPWDDDQPEAQPDAPAPPPLRALRGGGGSGAADAQVRLRREYKGPTVADLLQDERLQASLPGSVRSALAAVRRGDLAAAERQLPGGFGSAGRLVEGPGHRRARRQLLLRVLLLALCGSMLTALLLVFA